jgi:hypothetical protein
VCNVIQEQQAATSSRCAGQGAAGIAWNVEALEGTLKPQQIIIMSARG